MASPTEPSVVDSTPSVSSKNFFWGALPFVATPYSVVYSMLKLARVGESDTVMDLGSGDGRILVAALKEFSAKMAIGYELREDLINESLKALGSLDLSGKARVVKGDLLRADLSEATVITIYLTSTGSQMLRSKFEKEARKGTRIVSHGFAMEGWRPSRVDACEGHKVYLYKTPWAFGGGGWTGIRHGVRLFAAHFKT